MLLLKNFVIDRVRRGVMFNTNSGEPMWAINQITNPSLSVTTDTSDAVDALGSTIMTFDRAKNAEFSAENSLFDLGLMAAQSGTEIDYSTASNTYTVPYFDEITIATANTAVLARTPAAGTFKFIYKKNGDGTLGDKFTVGDSASGNVVSVNDKTVTFASGKANVGDYFIAFYEFTANGDIEAAQVVNDATHFGKSGRFVMEVLGVDVCDPSTLYSAYVEFPNAKLTSDFDLSFATDSTHPFTLRANQFYCDEERKLFRIVIPEAQSMA